MTARDFNPFRGLRELVANGVRFVVIGGIAGRAWGSPTITNALDDLIRMKRAADRPKDRIEVEILTAVKEEREKNESARGITAP